MEDDKEIKTSEQEPVPLGTEIKDYKNFQLELETLLNKHSIDNECNTHDFILSEYLCRQLQSLAELRRSNIRMSN